MEPQTEPSAPPVEITIEEAPEVAGEIIGKDNE